MADDFINQLTGGVKSADTSMYPRFQPMPQANPLAQIAQVQQLDLQNQALQQGQATLGLQRVGAVNSMLGTLITKPDLSYDDVTSKLDDMVRNRIIPSNEKPAILQHLSSDPEQLRAQLKNSYIQTLDHASKMGMGFGQPGSIGTGGGTQFFSSNPMTPGVVQRGSYVQHTLSPEAASSPTTIPGQAGETSTMTRQQFAGPSGTGQGGLAGAFKPPPSQPAMPGVPGPGAMFGPSLDAYNTDLRSSSDLAKTIRTSGQALQLADALGTTGTGPGTKPFNDAKAFLESVGITAPNDRVTMRNELDKYLQQTINNSPLAQRSDLGAISTKLGTPNTTEQTNAATRALLRTGIAQAGMDVAVPHAYDWQGNNGSVAGYLKHKGSFTQGQDQQAYALAQGLMQPTEAKALLDKMNALPAGNAQKQKFFESLANAKKAGLVNLPNAGQ
jgi:hypothetical protein